MDKFLTTEQVKGIIAGAPKGTSPQDVVNGLVSRGYTLQGFNENQQNSQQSGAALPAADKFIQKANDVVGSIFPGQKLGEALGGSIAAIQSSIRGDSTKATQSIIPTNKQITEAGSDSMNSALTAGSMAYNAAGGFAAKIGKNALLGATQSGLNAHANGQDVTSSALTGGALNAAGSGIGQALDHAVNKLPASIINRLLPSMESKIAQGVDMPQFVLHKNIGTTESILVDSQKAQQVLNQEIYSVLGGVSPVKTTTPTKLVSKESATNIVDMRGQTHDLFTSLKQSFPYRPDTKEGFAKVIKSVAPNHAEIVDKILNGQASALEMNTLRQELDSLTERRFKVEPPKLSKAKEVAATFSDILRQHVKDIAPETVPLFDELAKEITMSKALQKLGSKHSITGRLITDALGGYIGSLVFGGGATGWATGIAAAEGLRSPNVRLKTASALDTTGAAQPVVGAVNKVLRTQVPNIATQLNMQQEQN